MGHQRSGQNGRLNQFDDNHQDSMGDQDGLGDQDGGWAPASRRHARMGPQSRSASFGATASKGPRWLVPLRAVVVVLAMVAAALGVLWVESAGVQGATEQLQPSRAIAVPPLESGVMANETASALATAPNTVSTSATASASLLVVHVAGAVTQPGVFMLPAGSRVFEAVESAGGALPSAELTALNLAAELQDGTQILVPTIEQAAAGGIQPGSLPSTGGTASGTAGGTGDGGPAVPGGAPAPPVNLNTASAEQLEKLPGLGPVLATRIVQWRTDHGAFASVEGLQAVPGIGTKLLAGLRELVVVS